MLKLRTGIEATHIPYKGIGAPFTDLMTGKVQMAFSSLASALPFTTRQEGAADCDDRGQAHQRLPGPADPDRGRLGGLRGRPLARRVCAAGMPATVLSRLQRRAAEGTAVPDLEAALARVGVDPRGTSPEEGAAVSCAPNSRNGGR